MRGFFSKEKTQLKGGETKGFSCASCGLYKFALTPKMKPYGNFRKGIMVIGEAPGEDEDRRGKPWQGKAGRILQHKYRQLGIDLFDDCISLNAVCCHPGTGKGEERQPTSQEIICCRSKIVQAVRRYKPKVIILHGDAPVHSLIGRKWLKDLGSIAKWQGFQIPDKEYGAWVCPTFSPAFIERQESGNEADVIWTQDIKRAFDLVDTPLPQYRDEQEAVIITSDFEEVVEAMMRPGLMAFDIETTGLKPYDRGRHRIVSISFCNDQSIAYATPFPTRPKHLKMLKALLEDSTIGKIAANMKYEDTWMAVLHGINVKPWVFDTMQAAHVLDNRPGITGLKFQSYVRFGVVGYDDDISPYLKAPDSNSVNNIMELVKDSEMFRNLMLYNGIDSLMEYRLAALQMKELNIRA